MAELHTFVGAARHDCGYEHRAGEVTHRVIVRVDRRHNTIARLEAFLCNGCHGYGGRWTVDAARRRRLQAYIIVWTEKP